MVNDDSRTTLIEADSEEILPILDQFQDLRVFDKFFTESDFFLRKYEKSREDKEEKTEKLEDDENDNEMKKIHFPKLSLGPKPSGGARRKKSNPNLKVELLESGSKNGIPHTLRIDFISRKIAKKNFRTVFSVTPRPIDFPKMLILSQNRNRTKSPKFDQQQKWISEKSNFTRYKHKNRVCTFTIVYRNNRGEHGRSVR